jgi:hypothetical protein
MAMNALLNPLLYKSFAFASNDDDEVLVFPCEKDEFATRFCPVPRPEHTLCLVILCRAGGDRQSASPMRANQFPFPAQSLITFTFNCPHSSSSYSTLSLLFRVSADLSLSNTSFPSP